MVFLSITHTKHEKVLIDQMIAFCKEVFTEKFVEFSTSPPTFLRTFIFTLQVTSQNHVYEFVCKSSLKVDEEGLNSMEDWMRDSFFKSLVTFTLINQLHLSLFPTMVAYNEELFLIIMNKIKGISLDSILLADTSTEIEDYLLDFSNNLAVLHGKTASDAVFNDYIDLMHRFGFQDRKKIPSWFRGSLKTVDKLKDLLSSEGFELPNTFYKSLKDLFQTAESSNFLSIIHSDPCPDNVILNNDGLFFVDVDTVEFYYFFIDVAYFEIFFPSCWCVGIIPERTQKKMREKYFETINKYITIDWSTYYTNAFIGSVLYAVVNLVIYFNEYNGKKMIDENKWGIDSIYNRIKTRHEIIINRGTNFPEFKEVVDGFQLFRNLFQTKYGNSEGLKEYPVFSQENKIKD